MKTNVFSTKGENKVCPAKDKKVYSKPTCIKLRVKLNLLQQCPSCNSELTPTNNPIRHNNKIECELCI